MLLGLLCAILGLYGSATSQATMALLVSNLADLREDKPTEAATLETLAVQASILTRKSHKRLTTIGWITAGLSFIGAIIRKPEMEASNQGLLRTGDPRTARQSAEP